MNEKIYWSVTVSDAFCLLLAMALIIWWEVFLLSGESRYFEGWAGAINKPITRHLFWNGTISLSSCFCRLLKLTRKMLRPCSDEEWYVLVVIIVRSLESWTVTSFVHFCKWLQGFHERFQLEVNWFLQAGKMFWRELLYNRSFPLDGQTRWSKSFSQLVNLPGAWSEMKPLDYRMRRVQGFFTVESID